MRLLVIVLAAVLAVAQAVREESPYFEPRLIGSAMRIHRMEEEIEELKHEIKEAAKIDPLGFVMEMHARLDQVEGKFGV